MADYIEDYENKYYFDSTIDPPWFSEDRHNYDFYLVVRLFFEQMNPAGGKKSAFAPDHDGKQVAILRWNDAAWVHFTTTFVTKVMEVWDKAFMLIPPAKYDGFVFKPEDRRRNLICRLRIKLLKTAQGAHTSVKVVRLATPTRSTFRSDAEMFDSSDVDPNRRRFNPAGTTYLGNTPAHEVGHWLGLPHINASDDRCDPAQSNSYCYGTNLHDRMNIMGTGSMLDLADAWPWQKRIVKHVPAYKSEDWKVDWASNEAMLRGLAGMEVDENQKVPYKPVKPGLIDI